MSHCTVCLPRTPKSQDSILIYLLSYLHKFVTRLTELSANGTGRVVFWVVIQLSASDEFYAGLEDFQNPSVD